MISEAEAIRLDEDRCSKCRTCYSICPFEAISLDSDTGGMKIDAEKCQVCGICASVCPSSNIEIAYYDYQSLVDQLETQKEALKLDTLVIMCRGSSPPSCEILDVLKEQNVREFIPLRVPCVGRISPEFYLKALAIGIKKIIAVQCEEDFCRFKKGSEINIRRVAGLQILLDQLGYGKVLTIIKNPLQAVYDTKKCVGCDKCEFICPYNAIEAQPLATPQINFEKCQGCGACALVCPHLAIQLNGFEYDRLSQTIRNYKVEAEKLKSEGISPIVLVFCCQWAEFSALDRVRNGFLRENAAIVEIPCFNGLDPSQVLEAFTSGFDGVLAIICSDEDCKLSEGREAAKRNISALEIVLKKLNLANRFEVCPSSPRYLGDFDSKLDSFIAKISSLMVGGE
jgi:coenzyme F420-reducing hydrogenase delta subunit/Pyruvate/2-oxoacid:ferredoxin oxidoreductase delta subunit